MTQVTRPTRAQEVRGPIHDIQPTPWEEDGLLAAPPARPGMVQRWVASTRAGQAATSNLMRKKNQGWRPRMADTAPKDMACPALELPGVGNVIAIEGMILMERPVAIHDKHMARVSEQTKAQARAIRENVLNGNQDMRGMGSASMEVSRSVTRGRPVSIADDD